MSKWILIEVEDNTINEPDVYNTYDEAYAQMEQRFNEASRDSMKESEAGIKEDYAFVSYDSVTIDWRIFEVKV